MAVKTVPARHNGDGFSLTRPPELQALEHRFSDLSHLLADAERDYNAATVTVASETRNWLTMKAEALAADKPVPPKPEPDVFPEAAIETLRIYRQAQAIALRNLHEQQEQAQREAWAQSREHRHGPYRQVDEAMRLIERVQERLGGYVSAFEVVGGTGMYQVYSPVNTRLVRHDARAEFRRMTSMYEPDVQFAD